MKLSLIGSIALISAALSHVGATPISVDKRASGSVNYIQADSGGAVALVDSPSDTCLALSGGANELSNYSDSTAFLYGDASCSGGYDIVAVGGTWFKFEKSVYGFQLGSSH